MASRKAALITAEEYARMPDDDIPTELVRGRVVREPQPKYRHGRLQAVLIRVLDDHIRAHGLDLTCTGPLGCIVERGPDTVRGPDVAILRTSTQPAAIEFVEGAPALAIEILSPSNRPREIREKTAEYLAAGADQVWIVDERTRSVTIHRAHDDVRVLRATDRIDARPLMPDFVLSVDELFSQV